MVFAICACRGTTYTKYQLGKFLVHQHGSDIVKSWLLYHITLNRSTPGRINSSTSLTKGSVPAKTVRICNLARRSVQITQLHAQLLELFHTKCWRKWFVHVDMLPRPCCCSNLLAMLNAWLVMKWLKIKLSSIYVLILYITLLLSIMCKDVLFLF